MKKKSKSKKSSKKMLEECSEDLSLYEVQDKTEELKSFETERDCFSEGYEEDENIISRMILF